jgi:hypothetical protein
MTTVYKNLIEIIDESMKEIIITCRAFNKMRYLINQKSSELCEEFGIDVNDKCINHDGLILVLSNHEVILDMMYDKDEYIKNIRNTIDKTISTIISLAEPETLWYKRVLKLYWTHLEKRYRKETGHYFRLE